MREGQEFSRILPHSLIQREMPGGMDHAKHQAGGQRAVAVVREAPEQAWKCEAAPPQFLAQRAAE
jgi:hypothetical protein